MVVDLTFSILTSWMRIVAVLKCRWPLGVRWVPTSLCVIAGFDTVANRIARLVANRIAQF